MDLVSESVTSSARSSRTVFSESSSRETASRSLRAARISLTNARIIREVRAMVEARPAKFVVMTMGSMVYI